MGLVTGKGRRQLNETMKVRALAISEGTRAAVMQIATGLAEATKENMSRQKPLLPKTVEMKGNDEVLVDSGQLRDSIIGRVKVSKARALAAVAFRGSNRRMQTSAGRKESTEWGALQQAKRARRDGVRAREARGGGFRRLIRNGALAGIHAAKGRPFVVLEKRVYDDTGRRAIIKNLRNPQKSMSRGSAASVNMRALRLLRDLVRDALAFARQVEGG